MSTLNPFGRLGAIYRLGEPPAVKSDSPAYGFMLHGPKPGGLRSGPALKFGNRHGLVFV